MLPDALTLRQQLASGALSARQLTEQCLARIAQLDGMLHSVIELNPEALALADACDARRAANAPLAPLHGLPVLLKDNIATNDQMQTTAGSLALVDRRPPREAFIAARLRAAGAVILGKTNLSEWANFRSSRSSSGWSSRGGQTRNPYALDRSPCGSSSGSAVAVAAELCPLAVGTETDGSIVCPASVNGVVGIKPTVGLVSRSGIIPIARSQDTAGPLARTVAEAALLLTALCAADAEDPATEGTSAQDFVAACQPEALQGARLGVVRNYFGYHEGIDAVIERALAVMAELGATLIPVTLDTKGQWQQSELTVLYYEFKDGINRYLAALGDAALASLDDLIAYNTRYAEQLMPFFGQEHFIAASSKGSLADEAYRQALAHSRRLTRELGIDAVLRAKRLDALVAPTTGPAWVIDPLCGDRYLGSFSSPAAVAGYPHVTVPAGYHYGLPVGLSFVGSAHDDAKLIGYAYAFEQATRCRRPPTLAPTLNLKR